MTIQAQSADGVIHEFPDGTNPAVIDGAMRAYVQSQPAKPSLMKNVTGAMANLNRGLGIGDELAAGANTVRDVVTGNSGPNVFQTYKDEMKGQRKTEDSFNADHPHVAALARGTGNAVASALPGGPGANAFANGGRALNAVRGAVTAATTGAAYAAVDRGSMSERLKAASDASHDPVTLALGAGAGALAARGRPQAQPSPTLDELTRQRDAAYAAVDASGHRYDPQQTDALMQNIAGAMDQAGYHAGLHPKAAQMMERIGQSQRGTPGGFAPTLSELDQLRQQIGRDVAASPDPGERRMGQIMRDQIDQFIADSGTGNAEILQARDLNARVSKLRSLDNLDDQATRRAARTGSGGNRENTQRQNVDRFLTTTRNLTPDEQAQARATVMGSPAGNMFRLGGKLSPEGSGLMLAGHLAAAVPTHGVSAGIALGGAASKAISEAITSRNVNTLRSLIARGGTVAQEVSRQIAATPEADGLRRLLANDLSVAAGVEGQGANQSSPNLFAANANP